MDVNNNMPFRIRFLDRIVGLFIIVAIAFVVGGFVLVNIEKIKLEQGNAFHSQLTKSYNIEVETPIKLSDITIGKVTHISLLEDSSVRVDFKIFAKYSLFMTQGSKLEIGGSFLGSILGNTVLNFIHDRKAKEFIPVNSTIEIIPPVDVNEIVQKLELKAQAERVKKIISNLESSTGNIESIINELNQDKSSLFSALNNVRDITTNIADTTQQLPQFVGQLEQSISLIKNLVVSVESILNTVKGDVIGITGNTKKATQELSNTLNDVALLIQQVIPIVKNVEKGSHEIPVIISSGRDLLSNAVELTDKLNRHWLLGDNPVQPQGVSPAIHHDNDPYLEKDSSFKRP